MGSAHSTSRRMIEGECFEVVTVAWHEVSVTRSCRNASSATSQVNAWASRHLDRSIGGCYSFDHPAQISLAAWYLARASFSSFSVVAPHIRRSFVRSQVSLTPAQPNLHSLWTSNRPAPRVERVLCHACRLLLQIRQGRSLPQHLQTILVLFLYLVEV